MSGRRIPSQRQLVFPLLEALGARGGQARVPEVYEDVAARVGVSREERQQELACGRYRAFDRAVRWSQQLAKRRGLVVSPERAVWALTEAGLVMLRDARPGIVVTVYTTELGQALWAEAQTAFGHIAEGSVQLILTSPPYPLQLPKEYGNVPLEAYVEWFLPFARQMARVMRQDGSLVVNLGHAWERGRPVQSVYHYRLVVRLLDDLGLHLAQEFVWYNTAKLPGPAEWVTVRRIRVKDAFEHVFWLSKSPEPKANQRDVLVPYSEAMRRVLAAGGQRRRERPSGHAITGGFCRDNGGAIPGNVLAIPNTASNDAYQRGCREAGLPVHPARFPEQLAEFFIRLCTDPGDLVLDPFAGSNTTGAVAEHLGRRWVAFERHLPYLAGSVFRFTGGVMVPDPHAVQVAG